MTEFKDRLAEVMKERHLRAITLVEKCNEYSKDIKFKLTRADISNYLNGQRKAKYEKAKLIAETLGISTLWLLDGTEPKLLTNNNIVDNSVNNGTINQTITTAENSGLNGSTRPQTPLTKYEVELLDISRSLTIRSQVKLLTYAYDLKDSEKA